MKIAGQFPSRQKFLMEAVLRQDVIRKAQV